MRIVLLSDTHEQHREIAVPEGDLLVHAGDFTHRGDLEAIEEFDAWLGEQPHAHKVVIAGNHDRTFETTPEKAREKIRHATYLQDSGVTIGGVKIWGSPWQPWFLDWAFNLPRGAALRSKWDQIPADTDLLVTHGPPLGKLDHVKRGEDVGCEELAARLTELHVKLHVFGHIHEGYGVASANGVTYVNASNCDARYRANQAPIVVDWEDGRVRVAVEPATSARAKRGG